MGVVIGGDGGGGAGGGEKKEEEETEPGSEKKKFQRQMEEPIVEAKKKKLELFLLPPPFSTNSSPRVARARDNGAVRADGLAGRDEAGLAVGRECGPRRTSADRVLTRRASEAPRPACGAVVVGRVEVDAAPGAAGDREATRAGGATGAAVLRR